nr:MAG TPA: hypothetical protein [Bacteriophage sp.]
MCLFSRSCANRGGYFCILIFTDITIRHMRACPV